MSKKSSHYRADANMIMRSILNRAQVSIGPNLNAQDKRQRRNLFAAEQAFNRAGVFELYATFGGGGDSTKVAR